MNEIFKDVDGSIPGDISRHKTNYHIIPTTSLNIKAKSTKSSTLRIGLISFGYGKNWEEKVRWAKPDPIMGGTRFYLSCNDFGHGYLKFYKRMLKRFLRTSKANIYFINEYAFPSFRKKTKKCKEDKHRYKDILDYLYNLVNKQKVVLFPGTSYIFDNSVGKQPFNRQSRDTSQGILLGYKLPNDYSMVVYKSEKALRYKHEIDDHIPIEYFVSYPPTFTIFRTEFGNIGITICIDFLNIQQNHFFNDYFTSKPGSESQELSLLIVCTRDSSGRIFRRAEILSNSVNYGIVVVNSLDDCPEKEGAIKFYYKGKLMKYKYIDYVDEGFRAYLNTFEFDMRKPTRDRFRNYRYDSPKVEKVPK